jgi:predicted HTH domain antitoxin
MILEIPEAIADPCECDEAELLFGLTLGLYLQGRLSGGQAGEALGLPRSAFLDALHERGIAMPYAAEEATRDLAAVERLWPRQTHSGDPIR